MPHTYHDRLVAGLKAFGYVQATSTSGKYTTMSHPGKRLLFVGKSGALRTGPSPSNSISIGDPSRITPTYSTILAKGDEALNPTPEQALSKFA